MLVGRFMKLARLGILFALLSVSVVACSSAPDETSDSSESELRALTPAEIVGSIAYGDSKTVPYASAPKYRALSFQAAKGDKIDARFVGGNGVDPVGYLLSSSFGTLEHADDESAASNAAHVTHTISKAGTYYLAFRDAKTHAGDVTVTLKQVGAPPPVTPPPGNPADPFDAASCAGAPIASADLMAMLDPARGVLTKKVGRFTAHRRERACYTGLPCSDWRAGTRDITAPFPTLNATFSTSSASPNYQFGLDGDVNVSFAANTLHVDLGGDVHTASWGGAFTPDYLSESIRIAVASPTTAQGTANVSIPYTWMPSLGCPNGHCAGNDSVPGVATASWAGKTPLTLTGTVTKTCLRFATSAAENTTDASGNSYRLESDIVFTGNFANATCHAKTCADVNATCGSIADGCGGTIACGACANGQTCDGSSGTQSCRAMTAEEQCSASGRVFCPGHGGCWDACF